MTPDVSGLPNGRKPREQRFGLRSRVILGGLLGLVLVGVCGGWATTAKLSGAVIAPGSVKVVQHVKEVQHRDGGIVSEIAVREGDMVEAGQVLIRLDDTQSKSELAIVRGQLEELRGRQARLTAERDGLATIAFPPAFETADAELAMLIADESRLFQGNLLRRLRQQEQLALQVEQLEQEGYGLDAQLGALSEEIALVEVEQEKINKLAADDLIEGSRVYAIGRELTRLIGQRGEVEASLARAQGRIAEVQLQILTIDETAHNDAQRELRQVDADISELTERQVVIEERLARADIRSPIRGVVNELNVTTVGGIVTPAESLITLVPADAELRVEARLATVDVDQIALGQPAKLRFSAFNQRTTPEIDGTVTHLSAAAQLDPLTGESFYMGEFSINDRSDLGALVLRPGMPVEVFVQTTAITAIAYLAKPFTDQMNRAFREE